MKKILVPTDFSPCAENALDFAIQSARLLPAEITLLHAVDLLSTSQIDYLGVSLEFKQVQWKEDEKKLEEIKENIAKTHNIDIQTRLVASSLKDAIHESSKYGNFDLIVMGTLGASGLKETLWGSNTADAITVSEIPIMAIPHDYKWKKPEKFLLATGNFEKDSAILDRIFELAALYMAQVDVAVFTSDQEEPEVFLEHGRNTPYYEKLLTKKYEEQGLNAVQLSGPSLESALQAYIAEQHIDVLTMITYKKSFWHRLFYPSHTKRMSFHTKVPLLAIPVNRQKTEIHYCMD
ncbi:MAG: universal stress protein [Bacteroidetes bacterium]|nr:universal stress protein [Bacteroidota bacterium]